MKPYLFLALFLVGCGEEFPMHLWEYEESSAKRLVAYNFDHFCHEAFRMAKGTSWGDYQGVSVCSIDGDYFEIKYHQVQPKEMLEYKCCVGDMCVMIKSTEKVECSSVELKYKKLKEDSTFFGSAKFPAFTHPGDLVEPKAAK